MPSFDFNPKDSSAGFPVYPKGTYHVELGEPKTFYAAGKNNKADNFGIRYVGKITEASTDPKYVGKKFVVNLYQHTQESRDYAKQIQMAALGFVKKQEEQFDKFVEDLDWGFNTDDGSIGDGWRELQGQTLVFDLSVAMNDETGEEQQKTDAIRPLVLQNS